MSELEYLKNRLIETIQASNDADLLDLIFKLLLAECGDNRLEADALVCG